MKTNALIIYFVQILKKKVNMLHFGLINCPMLNVN